MAMSSTVNLNWATNSPAQKTMRTDRVVLRFPSLFSNSKGQIGFRLTLHAWLNLILDYAYYGVAVSKTESTVFGRKRIISFKVALTILLLHDVEWLQQLVFGTLHHTQPGPAFIFKCPEETQEWRAECPLHSSLSRCDNPPKTQFWNKKKRKKKNFCQR